MTGGYITGCCETASYILWTCVAYISCGFMLTLMFNSNPLFQPIYWVVFNISSSLLIIQNKSLLWSITSLFGALTILFLVIYLIGAPLSTTTSFNKNSHNKDIPYFADGSESFIRVIPEIIGLFFGIEMIPLMSEYVVEVSNLYRDINHSVLFFSCN